MNLSNGQHPEFLEKDFLLDEKAFEFFFRKYYRLLTGFCLNFIPRQHESEDIVQELFISLWNKRLHLVINGSLKHYLLISVKNRAIDCIRSESKSETVSLTEVYDISAVQFDELELKEFNRSFVSAVKALTPQCRIVFVLCRFEGYSYAETADLLGISSKTVENHMGRALRTLRENLDGIEKSSLPRLYLLFLLPAEWIEKLLNC